MASEPESAVRPRPEHRQPRLPRCARALLAGLLALAGACSEPPHPWDGPLDGAVDDPSRPFLGTPTPATTTRGFETSSRVNGLWVGCYAGFAQSGDPVSDVTRLGMLCGPSNGMVPFDEEPRRGRVEAGKGPRSYQFPAGRGECFRLFAAAELGVGDLDVVMRSSRGTTVARDHTDDGWPIVAPDGPVCSPGEDVFTIDVSSEQGSGAFAAQLYKLAGPRARGAAPPD
ncbi:MAG: hypothetical protein HY908_22520 [Myxococcales bacterium]|nr:hypothetical protein [Myxococcales bacterium]